MPVTYHIESDTGMVFTRGEGMVTSAELLEHQRRLAADPAFEPGYRQLSDYSAVTHTDASWGVIHELARNTPFHPESRRALVAPMDLVFGLARIFETFSEERSNVRVFRNREEATAWRDEHDIQAASAM